MKNLESSRQSRYTSEEQAIDIARFDPSDQELIGGLYAFLVGLDRTLASRQSGEVETNGLPTDEETSAVLHATRRLGSGTHDPMLAAALHDVRGGALTPLFVQLARARRGARRPELERAIAIAVRDHMKIMRNVVRGLDEEARRSDLARVPHSIGELAAALREFTADVEGRRITATVDCPAVELLIAETCVECAAVDRVAYNLLNNAAVHATSETIDVAIVASTSDVRVTVSNAISEQQASIVGPIVANDPAALFGSFTTTASGRGLQIVSDLVARAYGVSQLEALIAGGYVGVEIVRGAFVAWFHWPLSFSERAV